MSKQTIDGVSRDYVLRLTPEAHSVLLGMVEHCLNVRACMGMDEGYKDFVNEEDEHNFVKELRALLDAPKCSACNGTGQMHEPGCEPGACTACLERTAAQPQGEPVPIYQTEYMGEGGGGWHDVDKGAYDRYTQRDDYLTRIVYAEQPAPVAVVLPRHLDSDLRSPVYGFEKGWNACLDEVTRLNQAAKPICCGSCPGGCTIGAKP